jgi:transposase-like protein
MHLKVSELGKDKAAAEAARKFGFDAKSVDYWRDQATNGDENAPWAALFQSLQVLLTAKYPNSPTKQAKDLLDAHKRGVGR